MHNYRKLKTWLRSMDFEVGMYGVTANFPKEEKYGLTSQLRRSAVSVPGNIPEGAGRGTNNQFKRFLEFSVGSVNEVQTQLESARRFGYVEENACVQLIGEALQIYKMILAFYNSMRTE